MGVFGGCLKPMFLSLVKGIARQTLSVTVQTYTINIYTLFPQSFATETGKQNCRVSTYCSSNSRTCWNPDHHNPPKKIKSMGFNAPCSNLFFKHISGSSLMILFWSTPRGCSCASPILDTSKCPTTMSTFRRFPSNRCNGNAHDTVSQYSGCQFVLLKLLHHTPTTKTKRTRMWVRVLQACELETPSRCDKKPIK